MMLLTFCIVKWMTVIRGSGILKILHRELSNLECVCIEFDDSKFPRHDVVWFCA